MPKVRRPFEEDLKFIDLLRIAVTRLARSQRVVGARTHMAVPFSLMSTLSTVERVGPKTPTELAELEGVSKPSMTRALATLEERGYVTRKLHPTDNRQHIIVISKQGIAAVQRTRQHINEWYMDHLSRLSERDREALRNAVDALMRLADETL